MCGIEPTTMQTTRTMSGENGTRVVRRVPPLQGGEDLFGASSQGVALGWRVVAPLARRGTSSIALLARMDSCADGAKPVSPRQRLGNPATKNISSPERATPGGPRAQVRGVEQTIAGNVAKIIHSRADSTHTPVALGHQRPARRRTARAPGRTPRRAPGHQTRQPTLARSQRLVPAPAQRIR